MEGREEYHMNDEFIIAHVTYPHLPRYVIFSSSKSRPVPSSLISTGPANLHYCSIQGEGRQLVKFPERPPYEI
jgi:hypothetical protein